MTAAAKSNPLACCAFLNHCSESLSESLNILLPPEYNCYLPWQRKPRGNQWRPPASVLRGTLLGRWFGTWSPAGIQRGNYTGFASNSPSQPHASTLTSEFILITCITSCCMVCCSLCHTTEDYASAHRLRECIEKVVASSERYSMHNEDPRNQEHEALFDKP